MSSSSNLAISLVVLLSIIVQQSMAISQDHPCSVTMVCKKAQQLLVLASISAKADHVDRKLGDAHKQCIRKTWTKSGAQAEGVGFCSNLKVAVAAQEYYLKCMNAAGYPEDKLIVTIGSACN